jgi:hypothetical protein
MDGLVHVDVKVDDVDVEGSGSGLCNVSSAAEQAAIRNAFSSRLHGLDSEVRRLESRMQAPVDPK